MIWYQVHNKALLKEYGFGGDTVMMMLAFSLLPLVTFASAACCLKLERRAFLFKITNRSSVLLLAACATFDLTCKLRDVCTEEHVYQFVSIVTIQGLGLLLTAILALCGSQKISKWPCIGPVLVRFFLGRIGLLPEFGCSAIARFGKQANATSSSSRRPPNAGGSDQGRRY